jgi:predicted GIY-YIG superfamily endonuclease
MESLYVLQLENDKWYVGKTHDIAKRFKEHQSGKGSAWTTANKPLKIVETRRLKDEYDETNTTKELMKKYGIDNVRGGAYVQVVMPEHVEKTLKMEIRGDSGACFKCGLGGHFAVECPITIRETPPVARRSRLQTLAKNLSREYGVTCYRCGREGHYSSECYAKSHVNGTCLEEDSEEEEEDEWECDNCTRTFTTRFGCMVHQRHCH